MEAKIKTKLPGLKSGKILDKLKKTNLGYSNPYPFIHSKEGYGCYFKDIDGNTFLDFSSQIASNPLGYNHPDILELLKTYSNQHPIKYAGQDFTIKEHLDLLEELTSITPRGLTRAFLINSGAEAVENCIKIALRYKKEAKFGISFENAFHGRTLGALSCTNSKVVQKKHYLSLPVKRIPFNESGVEKLHALEHREVTAEEIGFVIIEPLQGEGGYNVAPNKLIRELRDFTKTHDIPLISDEVQSGLGRTGKWWAINHYNVSPDIMSSAKALQIGATISSKKFAVEPGSISSTWGGGHLLDTAIGLNTIKIIKKQKLLSNINRMGNYLQKRLKEVKNIRNIRGRGLMVAFDLPSKDIRNNFIIECLKNGLVLLGCSKEGVRVIPPYIVSKKEIDEAIDIIKKSSTKINKRQFRHSGKICRYLSCGEVHS